MASLMSCDRMFLFYGEETDLKDECGWKNLNRRVEDLCTWDISFISYQIGLLTFFRPLTGYFNPAETHLTF